MQDIFRIDNRRGEYMSVLVERKGDLVFEGLIFILHGLGGHKEQEHIQATADTFLEKGFTVVRYDATNSFGDAGGKYEDASVTSFYEDLEDVIAWASEQVFYQEPFCLAGHSLGGMAVGLFAEKFPEKVKALLLLSPVVSGELSFSSPQYKEKLKAWEEMGYLESVSQSTGKTRRLKWSHVEDRLKYDLMRDAAKLSMPKLIVVGSEDVSTPAGHQKILFEVLPDPKRLEIIDGADHNYRGDGQLDRVQEIIASWIRVSKEDEWELIKSRISKSS